MPRVLLVGAFGQRNPGDEALADAFLAALRGWEPVVSTSDPEGTRAAHGCDVVAAWKPLAVARAALSADAVVVAGGTVFKTLHPACGRLPIALLSKALALTSTARALGKPTAVVGVSAGDLRARAAPALARRLVHQTDLLVLRDEESADILGAAGAPPPFRIGADPTWSLLDQSPGGDPGGEAVVVTLSFLAGGMRLPDHLAAALAPLLEDGLDVRLQPWQVLDSAIDDLKLARAVSDRLDGPIEIMDPPANLADAARSFATARLVVGLRFHSLVAAAAAGVPFVAFAHEPKLAALARRLSQSAVGPTASPTALTEAIVAGMEQPPPSRGAVQGEVAAAVESFRLLRLLLSAGKSPEAEDIVGLPLEPPPEAVALGGRLRLIQGRQP